jgi:N-acetylneuraminic acid mutarotase
LTQRFYNFFERVFAVPIHVACETITKKKKPGEVTENIGVKSRIYLFMLLLPIIFQACEEMERQTLSSTALVSQTDSLILVSGLLVDLAPGESITSYGHCWSDNGVPVVTDQKSLYEAPLFKSSGSFTSRIDNFSANRTYYIRSFFTTATGEVRYGNLVTVTTGLTNGSWKKATDFFLASDITRDGVDCGFFDIEFMNMGVFMNAGFYSDKVFAGNGYGLQGIKSIDYHSNSAECIDYDLGTYKLSEQTLDFRTAYYRTLDDQSWNLATTIDIDICGFGGIGIVDGNLFYTGATTINYLTTIGMVFLEAYSRFPYSAVYSSNTFRVYDIQNNVWRELSPFPGNANFYASSFQLGDKIYVVSGMDGEFNPSKEMWSYDITTDEWIPMIDFPGRGRVHSMVFVANGKAYVGGGFTGFDLDDTSEDIYTYFPSDPVNDYYEYTPETYSWKRVADFAGSPRGGAFAFGIDNFGYVGTGASAIDGEFYKDFWRYDASNDQWKRLKDYPGNPRFGASGFSNSTTGAAGFGYVVTDFAAPTILYNPSFESDLWFYDPSKTFNHD